MEGMIIPAVVGILAGLGLGWLIFSGSKEPESDPYLRPLNVLTESLRDGRPGQVNPTDPPAVGLLREAVTAGWIPRSAHLEDALKQALGRVAAFLEESVQKPLKAAQAGDEALLREGVARALGGINDLEFFLREPITPDETHNLVALVQDVTREFIADWEVGVRFMAPAFPVRAHIHKDTFKDAVYLLLHNAAHFGGGATIELQVDGEGGQATISVRDKGPGFSEDALNRARDLFYTTKPAGLGLGIPFARKIVEGFGGNLELQNRSSGGAEVKLTLPSA